MFKKFLSALLAVMMIVSVITVAIVTTGAAETPAAATGELSDTLLYFDSSTTGWTMGATDKIAFHLFGGDIEKSLAWGSKKTQGTAVKGMDGVFSFDPAAKGYTLNEGVQYKVIFIHIVSNSPTDQTYDLLFDTTCMGHLGYANGTQYENPVDSSKKTLAAFWDGKDNAEYGPVLQISSIGNVIGTCPETGKTPESIFADFISVVTTDYNATGLNNARKNVVDVGKKTEQQLIDDIGTDLGLTKDDIQAAFDANPTDSEGEPITTTWDYATSVLPGGAAPTDPPTEPPHVHTPGEPVQENLVPANCQHAGSYDSVIYCTSCGEELSREEQVIGKLLHNPGEPVQENFVPATCQQAGGYDTVTYCTECGEELSREHTDIGKLLHTEGEPVQENVVPADCENGGSYDEVVYCTECGEEISREKKNTDPLGHQLTFVPEVPATEEAAGTAAHYECSECHKKFSDATGDVEVTDDELVIPQLTHELEFVDEVPATATVDGCKAHYVCKNCGKLYDAEDNTKEVTAEELVIPAQFVRGDADNNGSLESVDATTIQRKLVKYDVPSFNETAADADLDGEVDIIDVTLIQRVLAEITTFEDWDAKHTK